MAHAAADAGRVFGDIYDPFCLVSGQRNRAGTSGAFQHSGRRLHVRVFYRICYHPDSRRSPGRPPGSEICPVRRSAGHRSRLCGMSFITTYTQGFVVRIITGLGAGVVMACCTKVISEYFEQKDRGIAFGILLVGPTLGLTIANKLGAYLLTSYNWQTAFRITGYIAIAIAVLIFVAVRNARKADSAEKVTLLSGIKAVFTTRNLLVICLAGFFYMFLNLGVSTWANSYLANIGFDNRHCRFRHVHLQHRRHHRFPGHRFYC